MKGFTSRVTKDSILEITLRKGLVVGIDNAQYVEKDLNKSPEQRLTKFYERDDFLAFSDLSTSDLSKIFDLSKRFVLPDTLP